jgi:methyl-accepting chemotaxis protein
MVSAASSPNPAASRASRIGLGLCGRQTLVTGAVLAALAAALVLSYTSAVADQAFDALRLRGVSLARFLAAASAEGVQAGGEADLGALVDRLATDEDLVHLELVDAQGRPLAEGGPGQRPPAYALFDRTIGMPRAPAGRSDTVRGLLGEPIYIFSFPITGGAGETAPRMEAAPGAAASGAPGALGPRSAAASPRPRRRAAGGGLGEVRLAFTAAGIEGTRRALAWQGAGLGLLAVLGGVLSTHLMSRRTAAAVEATIGRARDGAGRIESLLGTIREAAEGLVGGSHEQQESLRRISAAVEGAARSIAQVSSGAGGLSASSDETSASILGMVASIEEVSGHADGLAMSVNDTSATTEEMVREIQEVDRNVELLNQFVAETSGAMARMGEAIQQVERNAADSKGISDLVAQNAEKGMRAVELTIEGMEGIRGSVAESSGVIESVGRRGQEIGLILNVIQEVTEQTNLLALNAAIIAAQAGEHGRGFAVVAEEIRQLAERTATSAKEIGALIASFQSETGKAVAAMQEGSRRVAEGSERSREAGRALQDILESARRSSAMVGAIAGATREQARGSQAIAGSVDKVREMVAQIKKATAEQTEASEQIMSAVENMREMAGHVKRATVDQSKGSRLITQAIASVTDSASAIRRAAADQAGASEQILAVLSGFATVTAANLGAATRLREAVESLRGRGFLDRSDPFQ